MHKVKRVIAMLPLLFLPIAALAANEVTVDADHTLILGDGSTYTLKNFSQFDAMSADTTTFSFTLSQGGRVTLVSDARKKFTTDAASPAKAVFSCDTDRSQVDLSIDTPFTTTTVTVTPSGTCTTGSGTGGGSGGGGSVGGGGGGSNSSTPVPAPATVDKVALLKNQIAQAQQKINERLSQINAGGSVGSVANLPASLAPGTSGDGVKTLQQILAKDKDIYPEGIVNGIFGPATTRAVKRFQKKYSLDQVGRVGPQTKKKLQEVFGTSVPAPAPAPATTPPAKTPAPSFSPSSASSAGASAVQDQINALQAKLIAAQIKLIQEKINALKK